MDKNPKYKTGKYKFLGENINRTVFNINSNNMFLICLSKNKKNLIKL